MEILAYEGEDSVSLREIKIGNLNVAGNIFLAPMAGITDLAFRLLCKEQGCSMVYTEMVSSKGLFYGSEKTEELLKIHPLEHPVGVQIFGSDPKIMGDIAEKISDTDIDLIDINMGCPAPKIVKNGEGSALLRDLDKVAAIIREVVKRSKKPVTVKIRKGWDDSSVNAVEVARIAWNEGASAVTVHGRTREQFYSGKADWEIIGRVKSAVEIPVIGNGDIFTPEDAKAMFETTGCDAVMVARGAQGNPWIFREIKHYLQTGEKLAPPTPREKIEMAIRHLELQVRLKGEKIGVVQMRKHIAWYIKGMYNASNLRDEINKMDEKQEIIGRLYQYLEEIEQL